VSKHAQLLWKQLKEESCAEEIPVFSLNSFSDAKFHQTMLVPQK
jgi:hypothetical protein